MSEMWKICENLLGYMQVIIESSSKKWHYIHIRGIYLRMCKVHNRWKKGNLII